MNLSHIADHLPLVHILVPSYDNDMLTQFSRYRHLCQFGYKKSNKIIVARNQYNFSTSSNQTDATFYGEYLALVGRLLAAYGLVHVTSEYGFELTLCEGPSMLPTIRSSGEIIFVDRLTPRLNGIEGGTIGMDRVRFARKQQEEFEKISGESNVRWHQPIVPVTQLPVAGKWSRLWEQTTTGVSVGDVVVVQHPDRKGTICKRVLGLPGDTIVRPPPTMRRRRRRRDDYGNRKFLVIPDGHIWIEGDNSMNSSDSRNYGPIPAAMIVGRVLCRVWPLRGDALMQRGARPRPSEGEPFSGSTIYPAGYDGEEIVRYTT